jgi:hypothetical protein
MWRKSGIISAIAGLSESVLRRCSLFLLVVIALFPLASLSSIQARSEAPAECIAVFDFELLDSSLEGEIKGSNPTEQQRLGLLTTGLRQWLAEGGRHQVCDMSPVAAEAKAANLSYCGCIQRLTQAVNGKLAIVGAVHKVSNLILNIGVDVFDAGTGKLVVQLNADIRSNSDNSWLRGLNWLIEHRLDGALRALEGSQL